MSAIKNTLDEINSRLNLQSKMLINLKTQQSKPSEMKQRNMTWEISEQSYGTTSRKWQNNIKQPNLGVIKVPEAGWGRTEKIFEEIFPNLKKSLNSLIQEAL